MVSNSWVDRTDRINYLRTLSVFLTVSDFRLCQTFANWLGESAFEIISLFFLGKSWCSLASYARSKVFERVELQNGHH